MRRVTALLGALTLSVAVTGSAVAGLAWRNATIYGAATREIRDLIQAEHRRVCGKTIDHDKQLREAARWKAMDMGFRDYFAHALQDGSYVWDYYAEAGISKRYGAGEIIAVNTYPDGQTAQVAFDGWMRSDGHRELIQACDFDHFGVGVFKTRGDGAYPQRWFVAEFTNLE